MGNIQPDQTVERISIFISYAHQDEVLLKELIKQLSFLDRLNMANIWYNRDIPAGGNWSNAIHTNLETAHLILLLISADFIASKYCYEIEMKRALERYHTKEARVIPIILRPAHWKKLPISALQALPTDGVPVVQWPTHDEAFLDVARGLFKEIRTMRATMTRTNLIASPAEHLPPKKTPERTGSPADVDHIQQGMALLHAGTYEQALQSYKETQHTDSNDATIYRLMGDTLIQQEQFVEAFALYRHAANLDAASYRAKGDMLRSLGDYATALEAYDIAIELAPDVVETYFKKGDLYVHMGLIAEAQTAYQQGNDLLCN